MKAVVLGNANLDVICYPVDDVPRFDSMDFQSSWAGAGGCGSNVAVGLCRLGIPTALVARTGMDEPGGLLDTFWHGLDLDTRLVRRMPGKTTGISVVLVDHDLQPRFIHIPGANADLCAADLDLQAYQEPGLCWLHVAGFFVLPGLFDGSLPAALAAAQEAGWGTSLDVVDSPAMDQPEVLWPCLPHLDLFFSNRREAGKLTGLQDAPAQAERLRQLGARSVAVKLGESGCWLDSPAFMGLVPSEAVPAVDTTGAGDAFAAGMIAGLLQGQDIKTACQSGNAAGRRVIGALGAIQGWFG